MMADVSDGNATGPAPVRLHRALNRIWRPAVAGALAAGVAMAAAELVAGLVRGAPSLITAIGSLVISLQPPGAKDLMIRLFGTNDKVALNVSVVVIALVVAGAALRDPLASQALAVGNAGVAVAAGLVVLLGLLRLASRASTAGDGPVESSAEDD